jgi:transcriptional regulator with XRE-family HTH domain
MLKHSTYTREAITKEVATNGSAQLSYELNGGKQTLSEMLREYMKKHNKTILDLAEDLKMSSTTTGKFVRQQNSGVNMGTLRKFSKLLDVPVVKLSQRLFAKHGKPKSQPASKHKLSELLSALGVSQAELACSFTIGDDRITVERMPGQSGEPVVVEHNGHRLTIAKA